MASWEEIESEAPRLAARARELFDAHAHKTLATLRADGSPRISGIEATFHAGQLWLGSMPGSRKSADLHRDPRFALHSGSEDPPGWTGDAKLSGLAEAIAERQRRAELFDAMGQGEGEKASRGEADLFRADIRELSVVGLNEARDELVIESWRAGRGVRRTTRK